MSTNTSKKVVINDEFLAVRAKINAVIKEAADTLAIARDMAKEKGLPLNTYRESNYIDEEAAVLAIERSLVPHPDTWTPEYAWQFALSKVCSSITSGKFRQFGYDHIFQILKKYPTGYWDKFQADLAAGKIKPFTGAKYEV